MEVDIPFVAKETNTLPTPYSFRDSGLPVPGAADIHYSLGRWLLAPDEALVITGTLPRCAFANVMLWNAHMQTLEYRARGSSLNQAQLALEDDGSFRIVIAHADPGGPQLAGLRGPRARHDLLAPPPTRGGPRPDGLHGRPPGRRLRLTRSRSGHSHPRPTAGESNQNGARGGQRARTRVPGACHSRPARTACTTLTWRSRKAASQ